jgi:hypothetical protein
MKHAPLLICLVVVASLGAAEQDTPAFRDFPNPGPDWSSADDGRLDDGRFSWRHYKHDKTGGVVACVAWHTPGLDIDASAIRQASTETVTSSGYAYAMTRKLGRPIEDTVRHQIASIKVQNHSAAQKAIHQVIEYTYVYENADGESHSAMAHGYVLVVGDFTVIIQHTSSRVITSDIAQSMAMDLGVAWSAKQVSIPTGWSVSISRPSNQ